MPHPFELTPQRKHGLFNSVVLVAALFLLSLLFIHGSETPGGPAIHTIHYEMGVPLIGTLPGS